MPNAKRIAGLILLVVGLVLLINSFSGIFFPLTIAPESPIFGNFDALRSVYWGGWQTRSDTSGEIYLKPQELIVSGNFSFWAQMVCRDEVFSRGWCNASFYYAIDDGSVFSGSIDPTRFSYNPNFTTSINSLRDEPFSKQINLSGLSNGKHSFKVFYARAEYPTERNLSMAFYFRKQSPLCDNYDTSRYVLSEATFVGGQTVNLQSLTTAMGNQSIIAFCPSKLPVVFLRPDTNEIISSSLIPYDSLQAGSYYTIPSGQAAMFWAITTRPAGISYQCDLNYYYDGAVCQPVPAIVFWCRITGQISADEGYCVVETTPKCVDANGIIVVNAVYNADTKLCQVFIPTSTFYKCIDSSGIEIPDAIFNPLTKTCSKGIPTLINYECVDSSGTKIPDAVFNPLTKTCSKGVPTEIKTDVVVPKGCRVTEYDSLGNPAKCVFEAIGGCEIGSLTELPDGSMVCKYKAPTQVEITIKQINIVQLIVAIILLILGIVLVL